MSDQGFFSSFFSSVFQTAHADDGSNASNGNGDNTSGQMSASVSTPAAEVHDSSDLGESDEKAGKEAAFKAKADAPSSDDEETEAVEEEEEEEDEPEDPAPAIREECANTKECAAAKKHFEHCEEKVRGGNGWAHEDCVEELFHLMHCVDTCAVPKIWSKLV